MLYSKLEEKFNEEARSRLKQSSESDGFGMGMMGMMGMGGMGMGGMGGMDLGSSKRRFI